MKRWTQKEDNLLKQYYQQYGGTYCIDLIDRTYGAVYERVKKLGLAQTTKRWTITEETIFKKYYPNYGTKYCSELLDKPYKTIIKKAFRLKIKINKKWNLEEDNILIDYYIERGVEHCSSLLDRPPKAISIRARKLGLLSNITSNGFSKKQIIEKLADNKVIALCQKHGESPHYFRKGKIQQCIKCASKRDIDYKKKERQMPLGLYKSRLRTSLNNAFRRLLQINHIKKRRGCFRHLPYSPWQLCDHLEAIKEQQNNQCPMCRQSYDSVQLTIDHIVPSKMAKTKEEMLKLFALDNLSLLCKSCNSSKGARMGAIECH